MRAVGFLGLGQMGAPMARRLLGWPGGLVVCDVRPEATAPLAESGAAVAATPRELATRAAVVSVMVLDDAQVEEVVAGPDGLLAGAAAGTVIAVHSTIRYDTAERLAAVAAGQGVDVVDAAVSGGVLGAATGDLAVMVGGPDAAVDRCRPVFEHWAGLVEHVGPVGTGTRAKLARNVVHFISFAAVDEAQRLAEAAGVDLAALGRVVRHSDAVTGGPGAVMVRDRTGPLDPGDGLYRALSHARTLGEKDLALALQLAAELGVRLPLAERALADLAAALGVPHDQTEEP